MGGTIFIYTDVVYKYLCAYKVSVEARGWRDTPTGLNRFAIVANVVKIGGRLS